MAAASQGRIFLSYRRQETAWPARQLYEVLVARFGAESVFKDVDDIDPGDDFVERITEAVGSCTVLLALIGNQWLTMTDAQGRRRLDNPDDFVRLEVEAALARGVRVVPVLVDGAVMPPADQLPPSMVALTRRQAVEISPTAFNPERLLVTLAGALTPPTREGAVPGPSADPAAGEAGPTPGSREAVPTPVSREAGPTPVSREAVPTPVSREAVPTPVSREAVPTPVAARTAVPAGASPATPELPATLRRRHPDSAQAAAGTPPAAAFGRAPRRWLVPVAVAAVALLLAGVLLVVRPWAAAVPAAAGSPSPAVSTPETSDTPTAPAAAGGPVVLAHRGGLEQHQFETQPALESAAAAGFSVETDVRYTSDGVAVLVHDEQATKGLDCGGRELRVSQTTWADLNRFCHSKPTAKDPVQYPVPKLDATLEGIAAASDSAEVFLEIKTDLDETTLRTLLDTPSRYGLRDRTVFTSASADRLAAVRELEPDTRTMLFVSGEPVPADTLADQGLWAVAVEQDVASQDYVDELKGIGAKVMVWNVNDPAQWASVMAYGPDIVMTDYPARFAEWLSKR